jgi:hypothetical protein
MFIHDNARVSIKTLIYRIPDDCGNDCMTVSCCWGVTWEDQAFLAVSFPFEVKMTQLTQKFPVCTEPEGH